MKKTIGLYMFIMICIFMGCNKVNAYLSFKVGDTVSYNGMNFYVIKDSDKDSDSLKLLKQIPIKSSEIKDYLPSTEIATNVDTSGTFARMPYYSRNNCQSVGDKSGCTNDYSLSDIKQVVDVWADNNLNTNDLVIDEYNYKARLITIDEINDAVGIKKVETSTSSYYRIPDSESWISINFHYWTMSPFENSSLDVYSVQSSKIDKDILFSSNPIDPVITVKKESIDYYNEIIEYNNIKFYVINDDKDNDRITLLKAYPIMSDEIKEYISSSEITDKVGTSNKFATIPYYHGGDCVSAGSQTECITNYDLSNIKQLVDIWADNYINSSDLTTDKFGYSVRLLTYDELVNNLGYNKATKDISNYNVNPEYTPSWVYSSSYCTMSSYEDSNNYIWNIGTSGNLYSVSVDSGKQVRPVVTLKRSKIISEGTIIDIDKEEDISNTNGETKSIFIVPNTLRNISIISIMLGVIAISISMIVVLKKIKYNGGKR